MKTLLIYPPCGSITAQNFTLPMGVCALKSFLVKNGQQATVLDLNIKTYLESEHKEFWEEKNLDFWINWQLFDQRILPSLNVQKIVDYLLSRDDDIIGFSINYTSANSALFLAKEIKKHSQKKVIFGGAECYDFYVERFLRNGVDAVVIGEGEQTLLDLVTDFKLCRGAYMLQNNEVVYGGARNLIDINTLPIPDFDDVIDDYKKINPHAWVSSSFLRGCTNRCAFCDESPYWRRVRQRTPENIVNELTFLKSKYNINGFHKCDSTLVDSADTMNKICDLMIQGNLGLEWSSQARPEKWLNLELLQKMSMAGCQGLFFGVESGSQKILNKMNKKLNVNVIKRVIKDTKKAGIKITINLMADPPQENLLDFLKTIIFVLKTGWGIQEINVSPASLPYRSDWYKNPSKYDIVIGPHRHWHSKYYRNNFIVAGIKLSILNIIKQLVFWLGRLFNLKKAYCHIKNASNQFLGQMGMWLKKRNPGLYDKLIKRKRGK